LLELVKENNPNKYSQFSTSLFKSAQQNGKTVSQEAVPPPPTKIYISYSRKQLGIARRLADDLQQVGFAVWWDVSDLKGGAEWERAIETAIKTSQYCLILLTPDSVESEWVRREYMYAISQHVQLIPVLYRDCQIPLALTAIQYLDFRRNKYTQGLKDLLATLGSATVTSKPVPLTLLDKLLIIARDPIWQMVGVIVAVVILTWGIYSFYLGGGLSNSMTPTPSKTSVAFATATSTLMPTNKPVSPPTRTNTPIAEEEVCNAVINATNSILRGSPDQFSTFLVNLYQNDCVHLLAITKDKEWVKVKYSDEDNRAVIGWLRVVILKPKVSLDTLPIE
jgi:hypothetical protein